jgi:hypothetical protein
MKIPFLRGPRSTPGGHKPSPEPVAVVQKVQGRNRFDLGVLLPILSMYAMLMLDVLDAPRAVYFVVTLFFSATMIVWGVSLIRQRPARRSLLKGQRPPAPQRRRFQYSLRTLLLLVLLASLGMSWFAVKIHRARAQRAAVIAIKKLGGSVRYDYQMALGATQWPQWLHHLFGDDIFGTVLYVDLSAPQITDDAIEALKGFPSPRRLFQLNTLHLGSARFTDDAIARLQGVGSHIVDLSIDRTQITDVGLQRLKALPRLQLLTFDHTRITEAGLKHLDSLTNLGSLTIRNTPFTDGSLQRLQHVLSNLSSLDLSGTQITDAGLKQIATMKRLSCLTLIGVPITDAGLEYLKKMPQLNYLTLAGTQITQEGVADLKRRLPGCHVNP